MKVVCKKVKCLKCGVSDNKMLENWRRKIKKACKSYRPTYTVRS